MNTINYKMVFAVALLIPIVVFWGWKKSNTKWPARVTEQIIQMGTAAVLVYFKKQLITLFNK